MPPRKQPYTLVELCIEEAAILAGNACISICEQHGDYENSICRRETNIIRNYFLENMGFSFENLCSFISRSLLPHRFPADLRILIDFMFHENKQTISLPGFEQMQEISSHLSSPFWAEKLGAMKRITNLDISEIHCTDEIVRAISDNCIHLELLHIYVSPKLTDQCLLLLRKCSELLIILDVSQFSTVAEIVIKLLVAGLPRLIAINYKHMGAVLSSGFENTTLLLRSVDERDAEVEHIEAIAKRCPNLKSLSLWSNMSSSDNILNSLTVSDLEVHTLVLKYFTSAQGALFLREKGKYLRTLKVIFPRTYNTKETLTMIGLNCPFLNQLLWVANESHNNGYIEVDHYKMSKEEEQKIFLNLDTLKFVIYASDIDHSILQLCLQNATHIKYIKIVLNGATDSYVDLHGILSKILLRNTMTHLNRLRIRSVCSFTSPTRALELIFNSLNSLKQFEYLSKMEDEVVDYFKLMESKILETNLDLKLTWFNLSDFPFQNDLQDIEEIDEIVANDENEDVEGQ